MALQPAASDRLPQNRLELFRWRLASDRPDRSRRCGPRERHPLRRHNLVSEAWQASGLRRHSCRYAASAGIALRPTAQGAARPEAPPSLSRDLARAASNRDRVNEVGHHDHHRPLPQMLPASKWKLAANSGREQFFGSFLKRARTQTAWSHSRECSVVGDFWLDPAIRKRCLKSSGLEKRIFSIAASRRPSKGSNRRLAGRIRAMALKRSQYH